MYYGYISWDEQGVFYTDQPPLKLDQYKRPKHQILYLKHHPISFSIKLSDQSVSLLNLQS